MPPGAPSARGGYRAGSMRILWAHREGGGLLVTLFLPR